MKDHVHKLSPSIIGLVETKLKASKTYKFTSILPSNWSHVHNCDLSEKGRIWIRWDTTIWTCHVLSSLQQITLQAVNKGGLEIMPSVLCSLWSLPFKGSSFGRISD